LDEDQFAKLCTQGPLLWNPILYSRYDSLSNLSADDPAQRQGKGLKGGKANFSGRRDLRPKRLFYAFDPDFQGYARGPLTDADKQACRRLRDPLVDHALYQSFVRGEAIKAELKPQGWAEALVSPSDVPVTLPGTSLPRRDRHLPYAGCDRRAAYSGNRRLSVGSRLSICHLSRFARL
jgi:hypothetical protein